MYCNFANEFLCLSEFGIIISQLHGLVCMSDGDLAAYIIIKSSFL